MVLTAFLLAALSWGGSVAVTPIRTRGALSSPAAAQSRVAPPCNRPVFQSNVAGCLSDFNRSVERSGFGERCPWPAVSSFYAKLKHCVDHWAVSSWCKGHGFLVDDVFLGVHETYFSLCGYVPDAPLTIVLTLTLSVIVATFLVPFLFIRIVSQGT